MCDLKPLLNKINTVTDVLPISEHDIICVYVLDMLPFYQSINRSLLTYIEENDELLHIPNNNDIYIKCILETISTSVNIDNDLIEYMAQLLADKTSSILSVSYLLPEYSMVLDYWNGFIVSNLVHLEMIQKMIRVQFGVWKEGYPYYWNGYRHDLMSGLEVLTLSYVVIKIKDKQYA